MEKAALRKLREDLKKDPSLANQYGVTLKSTQTDSVVVKKEVDIPVGGEWIEGYSPEGYVYYWNTVTKESRCELPTELSDSTVVVKVEGGDDNALIGPTATTSARLSEEQSTSSAKRKKEEEEDGTHGCAQCQLRQIKKKEAKRLKSENKLEKKKTGVAVSIPLESMICNPVASISGGEVPVIVAGEATLRASTPAAQPTIRVVDAPAAVPNLSAGASTGDEWGRDAWVVNEVCNIIEAMQPPWGTLRALEAASARFPDIDRSVLRMVVMSMLMSQRRCINRMLMAGVRRGLRRDENGFIKLDMELFYRYSSSF